MNYKEKTNIRATRNTYCNCEKRIYWGEGLFDIPAILPQEFDLNNFKEQITEARTYIAAGNDIKRRLSAAISNARK